MDPRTRSIPLLRRALAISVVALLPAGILGGPGMAAAQAPRQTPPVAGAVAAAPMALDRAEFDPGHIISDEIFYAPTRMTVDDIQAFLNSKNTSCSPGYTCLKDYRQDTHTIAATPMCGEVVGKSNQSAAQIIWDVSQACGINPQVILTILQKEQSLVTSRAPSARAYRSAMGAGCPDTAPCDSAYYGFFFQVHYGAYLLKRYTQPPGTGVGTAYPTRFDLRYPVGQVSDILNHPNRDCGTQPVFIRNQATHSLYVYTPYAPNAAAMSNLHGTGDACSSYGNRNFWVFFNTWFGSSTLPAGTTSFITAAYSDVLGRSPGASELRWWRIAMANGANRESVAGGFNNSDEYRLMRIDAAYREILGREPEESGRQWWLTMMRAGRLTPDDAHRNFLASAEYYRQAGGGTDEGYVEALYQEILDREAEPSGVEYWVDVLETSGMQALVDELWYSPETYDVRIAISYSSLLGRAPSASDLTYWRTFAQQYGEPAMRSRIMASAEYWNRASARFPE